MNCEHEDMELIYSDHDTGYIDISWCPECGALEFKDEDDYEFRKPNKEWAENETKDS